MNLAYLESGIRRKIWRVKGFLLKVYLLLHGCKVGNGLICKQWPIFRYIPDKNYEFGNNVIIGFRITFETDNTGKLILKDNVYLTQDILISSRSQVCLEEYVSIAEFVSIRDHDHMLKKGVFLPFQEHVSEPILLKKGSGVLRGASVFRGVVVEEGAIIGSECMLMRNFKSVADGIYFGNPPKLIGKRS
jgi:acetyltransferase-like isoleucine patch superfamily enzyme